MASSSPAPQPAGTGLDVRAFRALTYRLRDGEQLARVTSPAYDLVSADGRDALAAADPHNIVRLILPRVDPRTDQPAGVADGGTAQLAAQTLHRWEHEQVLVRAATAGLWRYELRCPVEGTTTGWLGAVGLPPAGSRSVLPHEDVFPGAVEGRRALLAATGTDLEPIVLAHDPDAEIEELTRATGTGAPTIQVLDADGVTHRLWSVDDAATVRRLRSTFSRTGAVIADGHHRFAAAREHARTGAPGSDAVLALLTPMGPGGLRVRAIHRVVPRLTLRDAVAAAGQGFRTRALAATGSLAAAGGVGAAVAAWLADPAGGCFLLTDGTDLVQLDHPSAAVRATVPQQAPPAWQQLDVVLAHHGLVAGLWHRRDDPASLLVAHDPQEALRLAEESHGTALLLRSPSPADVAAVARAGARMPRKSTLFVPKPRTGLVLRPHAG